MQLYIITNTENLGDDNNAKGLAMSIQQTNSEPITTTETSFDRLQNTLDPYEHNIIIAAGEHHLTDLRDFAIQDLGDSTYTLWSGHQLPNDLSSIVNIVDIVVLPYHIVNDDIKNLFQDSTTHLITCLGVAHTLNHEQLTQAHEQWQVQLPPLYEKKSYLSVVLAGDAPYNDGNRTTIRRFDEANAFYFGHYIATQAQIHQQHILITNGPRTGKHDSNHEPLANTHRDPSQIDAVTQAFCEGLATQGIQQQDYTLFNFIFGQGSAYHALLEAARRSNGHIYIPGESISMATECNDVLNHNLLSIYHNPAMNPLHEAFITELCNNKAIQRISIHGQPLAYKSNNHPSIPTVREHIGKMVVAHCINNTPPPRSPNTLSA